MTRTQRIATAVLTFSALAVAALPTLAVGQDSSLLETRRLAEQGDASAQLILGLMYDNGEGVPEDDAEAVRWYHMAAEQGLALAQYNLGGMYANGEGVPEDDAEAVRWFRMAAEQGDALAQYNLGVMYANGEGVPEDLRPCAGITWPPSKGTPWRSTTWVSCTPTAKACPKMMLRPCAGITWPPSKG